MLQQAHALDNLLLWHGAPNAEQPILTRDTWTMTRKRLIQSWLYLQLMPQPLVKQTSWFAPPTAGRKSRTIQLGPIYEDLGPQKAETLPGLHDMSGSDNTGSFAGKGKHAFWKAFQDPSEGILTVLINLWTTNQLQDDTAASLEQFICTVYQPQTQIVLLKKLRWWLFKKKQAESERLPPCPDALRQAYLRAHHLTIIWNLDTVPQPVIPPPDNYEWKQEDGGWTPVMTTQLSAPESVLH